MSQTEVQLIKDAVIVNADISNSAAIDVSKISGALPAAGGTITGDVTLDGATAGRDIVFDRSDNAIEFADDTQIRIGTGNDLTIFHESSSNFNVFRQNNALSTKWLAGSDTVVRFMTNGAVELYYDNSKKFQTTNTGVDIIGSDTTGSNLNGDLVINNAAGTRYAVFDASHTKLNFSDNAKITIGDSNDMQLFHDGSSSFISDEGTGSLKITTNGTGVDIQKGSSETIARFIADGAVQLYHNNTKTFETTSEGATFDTGSSSCVVRLTSNTDAVSLFQAFNNDLTIKAASGGGVFINANNSESAIHCNANGAVELYHDNSKKVHTQSLGVNVEGQIVIDHTGGTDGKGEIAFGESGRPFIDGFDNGNHGSGAGFDFRAGNGDYFMKTRQDAAVELYYDNTKRFETLSTGTQSRGLTKHLSEDQNTTQTIQPLYLSIPTNTTKTITLTLLLGTATFTAGGYANAGQGAIALRLFFGGAMFGTQHYNVDVNQNSAMQNTSITLTKNATSYVIAIQNSSSSYSLNLNLLLESTGRAMGYAVA